MDGKVALIVGGGSGIGRGTAARLVAAGHASSSPTCHARGPRPWPPSWATTRGLSPVT